MLFPPATCQRLVVKVGSSLLVAGDGAVRRDWLAGLVADIAERARAGQQVAVVSSGAIALGARRLGLAKGGRASLEDAQAAAATGQIALAGLWAELLHGEGLTAAQMLVTLGDLEERRRYSCLGNAGAAARAGGGAGDQRERQRRHRGDPLRRQRPARRAGRGGRPANGVLLLSDVDGLYDRDPADPAARHLARVEAIDAGVVAMARGGSASGMGSGGMAAKVQAARIATAAGIPLAIASGLRERPLSGEARHTLFLAERVAPARKAWLAGGLTAEGAIHVDAGAARALAAGGSLLVGGGDAGRGAVRARRPGDDRGPGGDRRARPRRI